MHWPMDLDLDKKFHCPGVASVWQFENNGYAVYSKNKRVEAARGG